MQRLTKTYPDGTHRAAEDLPCGENSWNYKELLIERLGSYEDTGYEPEKIKNIKCLLESAIEEIENIYGRETELTEQIRKELQV